MEQPVNLGPPVDLGPFAPTHCKECGHQLFYEPTENKVQCWNPGCSRLGKRVLWMVPERWLDEHGNPRP